MAKIILSLQFLGSPVWWLYTVYRQYNDAIVMSARYLFSLIVCRDNQTQYICWFIVQNNKGSLI